MEDFDIELDPDLFEEDEIIFYDEEYDDHAFDDEFEEEEE
jgi:hypothetical protein